MVNLSKLNVSLMGGEMLVGLCIVAGTVLVINQRKKKRLIKTEMKKVLDDYSYRDLFHFFINPEFHFDKLNLAKGFYFILN
jgi:hypothetical protein